MMCAVDDVVVKKACCCGGSACLDADRTTQTAVETECCVAKDAGAGERFDDKAMIDGTMRTTEACCDAVAVKTLMKSLMTTKLPQTATLATTQGAQSVCC